MQVIQLYHPVAEAAIFYTHTVFYECKTTQVAFPSLSFLIDQLGVGEGQDSIFRKIFWWKQQSSEQINHLVTEQNL